MSRWNPIGRETGRKGIIDASNAIEFAQSSTLDSLLLISVDLVESTLLRDYFLDSLSCTPEANDELDEISGEGGTMIEKDD